MTIKYNVKEKYLLVIPILNYSIKLIMFIPNYLVLI